MGTTYANVCRIISLIGLGNSWPVSEIDAIILNFTNHDSMGLEKISTTKKQEPPL